MYQQHNGARDGLYRPELTIILEVLRTPCTLCHIPRSRIHDPVFSYLVTEQFLAQPPRSFLNITMNELEMSIIADAEAMHGFASAVKADTERIQWARKEGPECIAEEIIEISEETWSVIIVETKEPPLEEVTLAATYRVRELSGPLAKAGISILYQSSFMNDFILVPTSRVEETIGVLLHSGYRIIDEQGRHRQSSPLGPSLGLFTTGDETSNAVPLFPPGELPTLLRFTTPSTPKNQRPQLSVSITGLSTSERNRSQSISSNASTLVSPLSATLSSHSAPSHPLLPISVLPGSFAMVGLTPQSTHSWTSLMIKLFLHPRLLYPSYWELPDGPACLEENPKLELGPGGLRTSSPITELDKTNSNAVACAVSAIPYAGFTRTAQGISLVTDVHTLYMLFPTVSDRNTMLVCGDELTDAIEYYARHGGGIPADYYTLYENNAHGNREGITGMTAFTPPPGQRWPQVRPDRERVSRMAAQRSGVYSCLQVDLRQFQLDKHGVVDRLSSVLHASRVDHLFSSSFKTSNVLVDCPNTQAALDILIESS